MRGIPDPSDPLSQQLKRLIRGFKIECEINPELTAYGLRHAFAIRLAELGLNYREAASQMGLEAQTQIAVYVKRLETPKVIQKI
jgi:integrase